LPAAGQRNLFFVIFFTDILLIVLILLRSRELIRLPVGRRPRSG
jgi:hypothetical protein